MNFIKKRKLSTKLISVIVLMMLTLQSYAIGWDTREAEFNTVEDKLNYCYKKILGVLIPSDQLKLKEAQSQWVAFRRLDCSWAFQYESLECLGKHTIDRLRELKETYFLDTKGNYITITCSEKREK